MDILNISLDGKKISCSGIFDEQAGLTTIHDIANELENSKTVIINTSSCSGRAEILVGSLITTEVFNKYYVPVMLWCSFIMPLEWDYKQ